MNYPKLLSKKRFHTQVKLNIERVNAQQARRLFRPGSWLYVSPYCWEKSGAGLSPRRLQSVAVLRLVVDAEREIKAFVSEECLICMLDLLTAKATELAYGKWLSTKKEF